VTGFGANDASVLKLDKMAQAYAVFGHGRLIWMLETDVPVAIAILSESGPEELQLIVWVLTFSGHVHQCGK
jgi:hypothetical protein